MSNESVVLAYKRMVPSTGPTQGATAIRSETIRDSRLVCSEMEPVFHLQKIDVEDAQQMLKITIRTPAMRRM